MSKPILSFENSRTRANDGAVVTLVNRETGDLRVVHRAGYSYEEWTGRVGTVKWARRDGKRRGDVARADEKRVRRGIGFLDVLRLLCAEADSWPGDWKIVTISTPISIYADLTSKRPMSATGAVSYEAALLSRAGRIDMWDGTYARDLHEQRRQLGLSTKGEPLACDTEEARIQAVRLQNPRGEGKSL